MNIIVCVFIMCLLFVVLLPNHVLGRIASLFTITEKCDKQDDWKEYFNPETFIPKQLGILNPNRMDYAMLLEAYDYWRESCLEAELELKRCENADIIRRANEIISNHQQTIIENSNRYAELIRAEEQFKLMHKVVGDYESSFDIKNVNSKGQFKSNSDDDRPWQIKAKEAYIMVCSGNSTIEEMAAYYNVKVETMEKYISLANKQVHSEFDGKNYSYSWLSAWNDRNMPISFHYETIPKPFQRLSELRSRKKESA